MKSRRITLMIDGSNVRQLKELQAKMIKEQGTNPDKFPLSISFSKVANLIMKCGLEAPRKWKKM